MLTPHSIQIEQRRAVAWLSPFPAVDARPIVVLLHGFPMDHHLWDEVVDQLASAARVVAVDLPGFGQSQSIGPVLGMDAAAHWLARGLTLWGIDQPIALIGLSMGGYIAMEFASAYPDRLSRWVLCNTKTEADTEAARDNRLQMAESVLGSGTESLAQSMPDKLLAATTRQRRPEVAQRLAEMIRRTDPAAVAAAQRGMAQRRSHSQTIRRLPIELLCVSGQEDALTGEDVMRPIAEQAPRGRLVTIAEAGHVTPLEAPAAWLAAVMPFVAPTPQTK